MYCVLPWKCSCHEGSIFLSVINIWFDRIGHYRDGCHLGISTILQHFSHTMKPNDLLLLNVTLHCGMYPAGKIDVSQHWPPLGPQEWLLVSPLRTLVHCLVADLLTSLDVYNLISGSNPKNCTSCFVRPLTHRDLFLVAIRLWKTQFVWICHFGYFLNSLFFADQKTPGQIVNFTFWQQPKKCFVRVFNP